MITADITRASEQVVYVIKVAQYTNLIAHC
jgi:hypothetical protein